MSETHSIRRYNVVRRSAAESTIIPLVLSLVQADAMNPLPLQAHTREL